MSPLDARPHVLVVYRTPGDDETPDHRWESPGIQTATHFPDRPSAEAMGKTVSHYAGAEYDVVALDFPNDGELAIAGAKQRVQAAFGTDDDYDRMRQTVLDNVDVVRLVGSLNPDEMGMGDYAYAPETRDLIRKVRTFLATIDD